MPNPFLSQLTICTFVIFHQKLGIMLFYYILRRCEHTGNEVIDMLDLGIGTWYRPNKRLWLPFYRTEGNGAMFSHPCGKEKTVLIFLMQS